MSDHGTDWLSTSTEILDHAAFAKFLVALAEDLRKNPSAWERIDLDEYLGAMAYWTMNRMEEFSRNSRGHAVPNPPTWTVFADIMRAARVIDE